MREIQDVFGEIVAKNLQGYPHYEQEDWMTEITFFYVEEL
jgi:hypothetical protein